MSIDQRLERLEQSRPQAANTWIRAVYDHRDGGMAENVIEEAKAVWRAAHPGRAREPLGVIVRTIVDPPSRNPAIVGA